jgi:hypothetical protein
VFLIGVDTYKSRKFTLELPLQPDARCTSDLLLHYCSADKQHVRNFQFFNRIGRFAPVITSLFQQSERLLHPQLQPLGCTGDGLLLTTQYKYSVHLSVQTSWVIGSEEIP